MSHTPGPWAVLNDGRHVDAKNGQYVCKVYNPEVGTLLANAYLLSAAPTMLSALEAIEEVPMDSYYHELVAVALKKARSE